MSQIGKEIRRARKGLNWTLRTLSERCGLSQGYISQIERGLASPSLVSLRKIYEALGADPPRKYPLFSRGRTYDTSTLVLRKGEHLRIEVPGLPVVYEYLSPSFPGRELEAVVNVFPPGSKHPAASHIAEEFGVLLEGSLILGIDGEEYRLRVSDTYQIPSGVSHSYECVSEEPVRVLLVTSSSLLDVDSSVMIALSRDRVSVGEDTREFAQQSEKRIKGGTS